MSAFWIIWLMDTFSYGTLDNSFFASISSFVNGSDSACNAGFVVHPSQCQPIVSMSLMETITVSELQTQLGFFLIEV